MDIATGPGRLPVSLDLNRFLEQWTSTLHLMTPAAQVVKRLHPATGRASAPAESLLEALLALARLADRQDGPVLLQVATWAEGSGTFLEVGVAQATEAEVRACEAVKHLEGALRQEGGALEVRPRGRRGATVLVRLPRVEAPGRLPAVSRGEAPRLRRAVG